MSKAVTTIAFSGAGHLLPYHLGVASGLRQASDGGRIPQIHAVSGSSSGSIAAAVLAFMPHRLEEYADKFLQDRGRAFHNFKQLMTDPRNQQHQHQVSPDRPELHVCVTKSHDGSPHMFPFSPHSGQANQEQVFRAIEASCRIPLSFHPLDLFKASVSYETEGIEIDSTFYVDGGISGLFPPTTQHDLDPTVSGHRILVTPISVKPTSRNNYNPQHNYESHLINPVSGFYIWGPKTRDGAVRVVPSFENLKSLNVAAGFAPASVLKDWYKRGKEDAKRFLKTKNFGQS